MREQRTAFVTGASRGLGRAIAAALATAGFDVAVTARTVEPGEAREHSPTVHRSDTTPLPGSLRETAALIEQAGREALVLPADLLDKAALGAAATTALERWGSLDVVVHNARFTGAGHVDAFLDTPVSAIEAHLQGSFVAQLVLNKIIVPAMVARGRGRILNITSAAGFGDPAEPPGRGGWGIAYGASKAAIHRAGNLLRLELEPHGILVINVDPGAMATERLVADRAAEGRTVAAERPEVAAAAVVWLATSEQAAARARETVFAPELCNELGLVPGWAGPQRVFSGVPDLTGARLAQIIARHHQASGRTRGLTG
jgi:NAD(P)-dependent dehydrogenase (short-subunit alcohol dehydrogenase family)